MLFRTSGLAFVQNPHTAHTSLIYRLQQSFITLFQIKFSTKKKKIQITNSHSIQFKKMWKKYFTLILLLFWVPLKFVGWVGLAEGGWGDMTPHLCSCQRECNRFYFRDSERLCQKPDTRSLIILLLIIVPFSN